jgi:hypothetical protein
MSQPSLEKAGLSRDEAKAILWAYLDAIQLHNAQINPCYIRSLGLADDIPGTCPPKVEWK